MPPLNPIPPRPPKPLPLRAKRELNFSAHIRNHRARLGLTQAELAEHLDVDASTISLWESGHAEPHKLARTEVLRIIQHLRTEDWK